MLAQQQVQQATPVRAEPRPDGEDARTPVTAVEVYGTPRSAAARRVVELLRRNAVPLRWHNVDEDAAAHALTEQHRPVGGDRPFVVAVDGRILVEPTEARVRDELGLPVESPAAAFRAFAAGATDAIVVGHGQGAELIVTAQSGSEGAVCTCVHHGRVWIAVGPSRLLALHRLVTRVRAGDAGFGEERGYGPALPDWKDLEVRAGVFSAPLAS